MIACVHAGLRRITPGGRCPLCEPREEPGLCELERRITPIREVRGDVKLELRDLERAVRAKDANAKAPPGSTPILPSDLLLDSSPTPFSTEPGANTERARLLAEIEALNREIAEAEYLLDQADAAACRRDFPTFLRFSWHEIDPSGRHYITNPGTDAIALHLQALADGVIKMLAIACSPGFGKPVDERGHVVEKTRGRIPLAEIKAGDSVLTHQGRFRRVLEVHEQGELPIVEIKTYRGRVVRCAPDHPVLTARGWVRADEVARYDVLAEVHADELGGAPMSHEEARLLGYLIGDGHIEKGASFTNEDPETLADFIACAGALGFEVMVRDYKKVRDGKPNFVGLRNGVANVAEWITQHGLSDVRSRSKRVPPTIMRADEESIAEYFAAYWACDGCVEDRRDIQRKDRECGGVVRISAVTISEGLARDHLALTNRLGMSFRVRRGVKKLSSAMTADPARVGEDYLIWELRAHDQDTCARFVERVGWRMRHEKRHRAKHLARTDFDRVLVADPIDSVGPGAPARCRCLTVDEDRSFSYEGVAVHNTSLASVAWPAFMWARDPTWRVICASHAFELARDIAGKFHRLVSSDWYRRVFPFVEVTGDALRAVTTSKGGTRYAVGVEGALTGLRSDAGLIDDSLNAIDAGSKAAVRAVNEWFEQGFSTRFDRRGREPAIGVIQQRLAENDLIALMRSLGAEVLELPARYEVGRRCSTSIWTDARTVDGEVLAPEIHPKEYLDERERVMGARAFAGQYQQRPAPREGNQFKVNMWGWCALAGDGAPSPQRPEKARTGAAHVIGRREDGSPDLDFACVSIDATAGSTSEDASALAVGLFAGKDLRRFLLRDFTRGPAGWTETLRRVETAIRAAGLILVRQKRLVVLLEKKAMGASDDAPLPTQVREMAAGEARRSDGSKIEPFVWGDGSPMTVKLELYEPTGKGDKQQRADAMEVDVDAGLVMILEGPDGTGARGEDWSPDYLEELGLFSGSGKSRDDRVDMTSQVIDHFRAPPTSSRFRDLRRAARVRR